MSLEEAFRKASKKNPALAETVAEATKQSSKSDALRRATEAVKRRWAEQDKKANKKA